MKFLEASQLLISTLSPVHVAVARITTRLITSLKIRPCMNLSRARRKSLDGSGSARIVRIVSNANNRRMLQEVQAFFYQRRQALITVAKRRVPAVPKLVEFYQDKIGANGAN